MNKKIRLVALASVLLSTVGLNVASLAAKPVDLTVVQTEVTGDKKIKLEKGKSIDESLKSVAPYITMNEQRIGTLDAKAARKAKVPEKAIKLAEKYLDEQNSLNSQILSGKSMKELIFNQETLKEFEDYFLYKSEGNDGNSGSGEVNTQASGGCGGDTDNPHPCPPREKKLTNVTLENGQQWLTNQGYHRTASYAGGGESSSPARDFTKCVDAYNCVWCSFRYQGVIADNGNGSYDVIVQVPEPNPEIYTYDAPTWTWDYYVWWWHNYYC